MRFMARDTADVLAAIDSVVSAVDSVAVERHLVEGTCDGADAYIMLCGSVSAAVANMYALVDNDGCAQREDVLALSHGRDCRCTLCLWPSFPPDEGEPWLAAAPSFTHGPLGHLVYHERLRSGL